MGKIFKAFPAFTFAFPSSLNTRPLFSVELFNLLPNSPLDNPPAL